MCKLTALLLLTTLVVRSCLYTPSTRLGKGMNWYQSAKRYHLEVCPCKHSRYQEKRVPPSTWETDDTAHVSSARSCVDCAIVLAECIRSTASCLAKLRLYIAGTYGSV